MWFYFLFSVLEDRGFPQSLPDLIEDLFIGAVTSDKLLHRRQCMRSFAALTPLLQPSSSRFAGDDPHVAMKAGVLEFFTHRASSLYGKKCAVSTAEAHIVHG